MMELRISSQVFAGENTRAPCVAHSFMKNILGYLTLDNGFRISGGEF